MRVLRHSWLTGAAFALTFFAFAPVPSYAAQEKGAKQEAEADEEEADEEEEDEYFAIVGGDVYSGTGAVMRGVTILAKNGKIESIGPDPYLPDDAEILDATGMRVYPGLVALSATSSISGGLFSAEDPYSQEIDDIDPHMGLDTLTGDEWEDVFGHPVAEGGDAYDFPDAQAEGAKNQIEDSFDPFSQYLVLALATGITTAEQSSAAIKLRRGEIDDILMKEKHLVPVAWSVSNPSTIRGTREKFAKAAEYIRKYMAWDALDKDAKKGKKEPSKKGVDTGVLRILRGDQLARFNANDREDLYGIARFAQEFHFRPVINGCREGWTVAGELGRAGAYAIVTPRNRSAKDERLLRPGGSSIENAAILHDSGVQVAIKPGATNFSLGGMAGRDLLHLPVEAGFGVRGGMSQEAAIEAITIVPARILGVDHRVGSLEVGKDMDAIVTDGDLLHYQTFVQWAVVAGDLVYDKQEEIFFAHIRPRPEPEPEVIEEVEEDPEEAEEETAEDAEDAEEDGEEGEGEDEEEAGDEDGDEDGRR